MSANSSTADTDSRGSYRARGEGSGYRNRGDGLHGLDRHRLTEDESGDDAEQPGENEYSTCVQTTDDDETQGKRHERAQVPKGAAHFCQVESQLCPRLAHRKAARV